MSSRSGLLAVSILFVSFNLRPAVASVGPVLTEVRDGLNLASSSAALLTTLPVLCFGVLALFAPRLARRHGIEPVLVAVLLLLIGGLLLRIAGGPTFLFAGTAVAAGAIAVANVLVPALVKREFAARTGLLMGAYTAALAGSAAVAAGLTVPAAHWLGGGWRSGLAVWAAPAGLALLLWLPEVRRRSRHVPVSATTGELRRMLHSPVAWQVTLFMGLQSLAFYAVLAWLPTIYQDAGWSPTAAGALLSVSVLVQVPVALLVPVVAARSTDQRVLAASTTLLTATGLLGVLLVPTVSAWLWAVVLGIGQGGNIALALTLFVLRSDSPSNTAGLSAMAQSVGYSIAALGPLMLGLLHERSGDWTTPLTALLLVCAVQLAAGVLAGRDLTVGSSR